MFVTQCSGFKELPGRDGCRHVNVCSMEPGLGLGQWFLTGGSKYISRGERGLARPTTLVSLISKFTNKYICLCSLFKVRGA